MTNNESTRQIPSVEPPKVLAYGRLRYLAASPPDKEKGPRS